MKWVCVDFCLDDFWLDYFKSLLHFSNSQVTVIFRSSSSSKIPKKSTSNFDILSFIKSTLDQPEGITVYIFISSSIFVLVLIPYS